MFRKLCARAIIPVALAVTGFVVLCCILLYSLIKGDLLDHEAKQSAALAGTVLKSARYAMLRDDRETLRNILQNIAAQPGVEHTRIFNKEGRVMFSGKPEELNRTVDTRAEGCSGCHFGSEPVALPELSRMTRRFTNARGMEVLAVTAPIFNEPECGGTACHPPLDRQKVLGMLDIGLDQAPLQKALAILQLRMTLFSLMVLVLTVGGVAALLNRQVFIPIRRLSDFTNSVVDGNLDEELAGGCGELEDVAAQVRTLATDLGAAHRRVRRLEDEIAVDRASGLARKGVVHDVPEPAREDQDAGRARARGADPRFRPTSAGDSKEN